MQLIVLGMHRSGTSAVTRILNMAGAYFGPEGISNGSDQGNPKGFWERRDVRAVCDGLLQDSGFDWWRLADFSVDRIPPEVRDTHLAELRRILLELDAHRPWVLKEPRLSVLLPLVRPLLEVPVCVHVTREPLEVAESLRARNGIPVSVGLALWETYTIRSFADAEGMPRLLVRYEDLMADPNATVAALIEGVTALGVAGLRLPTEREIGAFLTPDLHRQRRTPEQRLAFATRRQVDLAALFDEAPAEQGRIPATADLGAVSEGATDAMRSYEAARDHELAVQAEHEAELAAAQQQAADEAAAVAAETSEAAATAAAALADAERRVAAVSAELDRRQERFDRERQSARDHSAIVNEALARAERQVRLLAGSRSWKLANGLNRATHLVGPTSAAARGPVDKLAADIRRARNHLEREPRDEEEARAEVPSPPVDQPPADPAAAATAKSGHAPGQPQGRTSGRLSVAVLAWDVGHNPLGRAYVMADMLRRHFDVEIWGTQFARYGSDIWPPLQGTDIPIHTFPGGPFPDHLATMAAVARTIDADAIWVSKPRFPSFGLGILAKQFRDRPLVLDVDDHELSFFPGAEGIEPDELLARAGDTDLVLPFGQSWTQVCEPLIGAADALTVSNVALQERFGGTIVPHARDERVFDPDRYDRTATRRRLGLDDSHRLLLFGGTPRVHKGVVEVVRALDELGDDRYRLLCFGTREFAEVRRVLGPLERWTIVLPNQAFDALPELVNAADLACVLQDPEHPVARYQMPAKVTDALAMGVPCLVTPVPPLLPLVDAGVLHVHDGSVPLHERIAAIFADPADAADRAARGRKAFLESFSYDAVGSLAAATILSAVASPAPLSPRLARLVELPTEAFTAGAARPVTVANPRRPARPMPAGDEYDVVMFWKQNDSGIYGRRQDMFVKYLARSGRVRSIVHFDRPTTPEALYRTYRQGGRGTDHNRLVVRQTMARLVPRRSPDRVHRHTFLHGGPTSARFGLRPGSRQVDHVRRVLARHGVVGDRPLVLWGYPTNEDLPELIDALAPDLVVTDVVDDHRTFAEPGSARHLEFDRNYREVLARSDVVLANCEPVAAAMAGMGPEIHVVPNGAELPAAVTTTASSVRPAELAGITGPIVGYVGNLSQRLDVRLLDDLVMAHPEWQFVLVGSAHHDRSVLVLESEPNVHFLGVKPYDEMVRLVRHFDVALIPHLVNDMTASMNPLKAFVYAAAGVPVVSTPVANLAEFDGLISVAEGVEGFGAAITAALAAGRRPVDPDLLRPHSWEVRVSQALDLVDRAAEAARHR